MAGRNRRKIDPFFYSRMKCNAVVDRVQAPFCPSVADTVTEYEATVYRSPRQ